MSSFYGNIKFNNQTPLIFDKIYSSRYQMEQNCHSDGIFNGRFILVSYGDIRYTPYHKVEPMNDEVFNANRQAGTIYYITSSEGDSFGFREVANSEAFNAYNDYYIRTVYSIDESSTFAANKSEDEIEYNHDYHNTVWQKIWTSTQDSTEIEEKYIMVSHLNAETPRVSMIVDAPNDVMEFDKTNQVFYLVPTNQHALNIPGTISEDDFVKNKHRLFTRSDIQINGEYKFSLVAEDAEWNIDTVYYIYQNDVYDPFPNSKAYTDGMISEELYIDLIQNRKIPLFIKNNKNEYSAATNWNRLTKYYFMRYRETDGRPHFDPIMSTDLEYRFHMPRNWKWDNELDFDYNLAGFNPTKANYTNTERNEIILTTKNSGDIYPVHRSDEPSAGLYKLENNELVLQKTEQPDTKRFDFNLRMLGDAVSNMWDKVYPRKQLNDPKSERDVYIGNDRLRPENDQENYPETLAEAVRKLYYWLGLKTDNNFVQGPWVDPKTGEKVDTIFGVLNGASDLLGSFGDTFKDDQFIPIASPYYPNGFGHYINEEEYTQLTLEEFNLLNDGGAGPLYIKKEDGSYEQATGYDYNEQYYRNMNSLLALLRAWQDIVKDTQADWTYDVGHVEWNQNNPLHPRFIRNKPVVLTVDLTAEDESSINWYWKNYAL